MKASKKKKNAIDKQPPLSSDEKEEIEGDEDALNL
jgi:hypothetical protein